VLVSLLLIALGVVVYLQRKSDRANKLLKAAKSESHKQLAKKSAEVFDIVDKLRKTQMVLLESGRASALATLSSGILHQISQPITALYGMAKYMKEEVKEDDKFYKPVCLMEEQAVELKGKLENLMQLVSHHKLVKETININDVITKAMGLLVDEMKKRRIRWLAHLGQDMPVIYGDSIALQQVIMNIAMNSAQSLEGTEKDYIRHFVISSEYDKTKDEIMIIFIDNGPGIIATDQEKVFEPFFTTKKNALGIGLSLCKNLLAEHLGSIEFTSEREETIFKVRIPSKNSHALQVRKEQDVDKLKILVVDDKKIIGDVFDVVLGRKGHEVKYANNLKDVISLVKTVNFDMAFVDIIIPETDGIEILEEIKNVRADLPVAMMTGYSVSDKKEQAQMKGAVTILKKPFDLDDVRKVVKEATGKEI